MRRPKKGLAEDSSAACERGASFGYNNLVSDMRGLAIMRETGAPVVFDATHSIPVPSEQLGRSRELVPVLSRAAVAVGVAGLFMETHPDPNKALSDGPNAVPLKHESAARDARRPRPHHQEELASRERLRRLIQPAHPETPRGGYVIAYVDVTNPVQYGTRNCPPRPCRRTAPKCACAGAKVQPLEGDWHPRRVVLLKFPSFEHAKAFYETQEYRRARDARAGTATMNMIAVEGL